MNGMPYTQGGPATKAPNSGQGHYASGHATGSTLSNDIPVSVENSNPCTSEVMPGVVEEACKPKPKK